MPIILILIGSIGWCWNIVQSWSMAGNVDNAMAVSASTGTALNFLWVAFIGGVWQLFRK